MPWIKDSKTKTDGNNLVGRTRGGMGGNRGTRDYIGEFLVAPKCEVCRASLERKTMRDGQLETMKRWRGRRTCGKIQDSLGHWKWSECLLTITRGKNNGNYKGLMPKCIDCGKRTSYSTIAERKQKGDPKRCGKCFKKWARKTKYWENTEQIKHLNKVGKERKGIYPEALKPYAFVKGQRATNKKYDYCQTEGCKNKHIANGICGKHYQRMANISKNKKRMIECIEKHLPQFKEMCKQEADVILLHQDAFATNYQAQEMKILGKAIKYAGMHGKEVRIIL